MIYFDETRGDGGKRNQEFYYYFIILKLEFRRCMAVFLWLVKKIEVRMCSISLLIDHKSRHISLG